MKPFLLALILAFSSVATHAQNSDVGQENLTGAIGPCDVPLLILDCGAGISRGRDAQKGTGTCGVGLTFLPYMVSEFGVIGPQAANGRAVSGYFSQDAKVAVGTNLRLVQRHHETPFVAGGYTRFWDTGNATSFGIGVLRAKEGQRSWQVEARDYVAFTAPREQNITLRLGYVLGSK